MPQEEQVGKDGLGDLAEEITRAGGGDGRHGRVGRRHAGGDAVQNLADGLNQKES